MVATKPKKYRALAPVGILSNAAAQEFTQVTSNDKIVKKIITTKIRAIGLATLFGSVWKT